MFARLGEVFSPDEATIVERLLREYGDTIPNKQLIEAIWLAVAIRPRQQF